MKQCPECKRGYADETLNYCLDDGTPLAIGAVESPTALLHTTNPVSEAPTRSIAPFEAIPTNTNGKLPGSFLMRRSVWLLAGLLLAAAAGAYAVYRIASRSQTPQHFRSIRLSRVTTEASVESATISPDGKYVAYTLEESGKRSLWTKNLVSDSRVQIVPPAESLSMYASAFSPDGSFVYYTRVDDQEPKGAAYIVPVLGGDPRKLLADVSQPVSISSDGKRIAYGRYHFDGPEDHLFVANADGTGETLVFTVREPDFLSRAAPAWSPDGNSLAVGYGSQAEGSDPAAPRYDMALSVLSLADGKLRRVTKQSWPYMGSVAWTPEGNVLVFVVSFMPSSASQIWQCPLGTGESVHVTNDLNSYDLLSLAITSDSGSLIAVQSGPVSQIWVAPAADAGRARLVTTQKNAQDGRLGLSWTPDGRIVYDSDLNARVGLWVMNPDGSGPRQLTENTVNGFCPEVSADGTIFFQSTRDGYQVWRMDADGRNSRQLTRGEGAPTHSVSPDGKWLIYNPFLGGVYKMPSGGGDPVNVVSAAGDLVYPQVSPDGKLLAYFLTGGDTRRPRIVVVNFEDGSPYKTFDLPISAAPPHFRSLSYRGFHWSADGTGLVYINSLGGVSNLWRQPLDGGPAKQITDFKTDRIYNFAYSRDGRSIAFARGSNSPDAVLISEQK